MVAARATALTFMFDEGFLAELMNNNGNGFSVYWRAINY
jgi:hypothetical protein